MSSNIPKFVPKHKVGFYLANTNKFTSIDAVTSINRKRYKYQTGVSIKANKWDKKKQRVKYSTDYPEADTYNMRLDLIENAIRIVANELITSATSLNTSEFKERAKGILDPKTNTTKERPNLVDFAKEYIDRKVIEASSKETYYTQLKYLNNMQKHYKRTFYVNDLNDEMFGLLVDYCKYKKYSVATYNLIDSLLKDVHEVAKKFGHVSKEAQLTAQKIKKQPQTAVYNTLEELQKIYELDFSTIKSSKAYENVRDLYLIGAFTAFRYSDYSNLINVKHTDEYITKVSKKTNVKTVIPMHPIVREILKKRNNILPKPIDSSNAVKSIRKIGKMAGITEPIETIKYTVAGKITEIKPKYVLMGTHTARRSACTNMHLAGLDLYTIMNFSGHKDVKSLLNYIQATQQQIAEKALNHEFFNTPTK